MTEEELKSGIMVTVESTLKKRRLYMGIRKFLETLRQQEREYYEAIQNGAIKAAPSRADGQDVGWVLWLCKCARTTHDGKKVILNFEHTVWTCPNCGKVYAFRIQQPEEMEELAKGRGIII